MVSASSSFGMPDIDLFASRLHHKVPRFVLWKPEPNAECVNDFSMSWSDIYCYIYAPFSLLARIAQKIRHDGAEVIIVMPLWSTEPWFTLLMRMLVDHPKLLPQRRDLLTLPHKPGTPHPLHHLRLITCRLSGNISRQEAFQKRLLRSSATHGANPPALNMASISRNGGFIVVRDRLISISPL